MKETVEQLSSMSKDVFFTFLLSAIICMSKKLRHNKILYKVCVQVATEKDSKNVTKTTEIKGWDVGKACQLRW